MGYRPKVRNVCSRSNGQKWNVDVQLFFTSRSRVECVALLIIHKQRNV